MLILYMVFKIFLLFLQCHSVDPANEAKILFIVINRLPLVSQLSKRVDHDTGDDICEQQGEEHEVKRIIEELTRVPLRHRCPDHPGRHQGDHAAD